jgi:hypothetical protein
VLSIPSTLLALSGLSGDIALMSGNSDAKEPEARDKEAVVRQATRERAPDGDEEPIEPSSPPCYLREFSEGEPDSESH